MGIKNTEVSYDTNTVSLSEALDLVVNFGHEISFFLRGEPGIGKTSGLKDAIRKRFGDRMRFMYFDCANMTAGEVGLPTFIDIDGTMQSTWAPNVAFGIHSQIPVCIVLDEYSKASDEVRNMFLTALHEKRMFNYPLPAPEQSIVCGTGNLEHEGLGDRMKAHQWNRMGILNVKKPTADEWIWDWAVPNGIAPEIIAWAEKDAGVFDSYLNYPEGSTSVPGMIFNPRRPMKGAFVTPRSLAMASKLVAGRHMMPSTNAFMRALEGVIGVAGANALHIFIELADKLPSDDAVVANPKRVKIPEGMVEQALLAMNVALRATAPTMNARLEFMSRLPDELLAIFMKMVFSRDKKLFATNQKCIEYGGKYSWIL